MTQDTTKIHVRKLPEVSELAGEKVMMDYDSGKYFILSGAANDIWELLADGATVGAVVGALLERYDVEESVCRAAALEFLEKLASLGFIELKADA